MSDATDNPWAGGHSVAVLRGVSATIVPTVSSYLVQSLMIGGVYAERIRALKPPSANRSLLYFHGGAYLCGRPDQYRNMTVSLARQVAGEVLSVDYRLAPEHGFPAAFEDALVAYRWLDQHRPYNELVIAGDSAGAAIAVATALDAPRVGARSPIAVLCNSPFADLTLTGASLDDPKRNQSEPNRKTVEWLVQTFEDASDSLERDDPRVSPIFRDLAGLPPLLVQTGGLDNLEDDGIRLAERALECGVEVECSSYPDCPHIWPVFSPPETDRQSAAAVDEMAAFVARHSR